VILLENSGKIFRLTTGGAGTMQDTGSLMAPGAFYYPSVMFDDCGKQRSNHVRRPRSRGGLHPFIQFGAAANPCGVLSERNHDHREREFRSGTNSAGLLYALCIQYKSRAGSGENCLHPPSRSKRGAVSRVESAEEGVQRPPRPRRPLAVKWARRDPRQGS
jgi:hypothetical protein